MKESRRMGVRKMGEQRKMEAQSYMPDIAAVRILNNEHSGKVEEIKSIL